MLSMWDTFLLNKISLEQHHHYLDFVAKGEMTLGSRLDLINFTINANSDWI
jgi:hypothetical protein